MIFEMLIKLIFGVVNVLLALIPKIEAPQGLIGLAGDASTLIGYAAYFLPLPTIVICLTTIFVIDNIKLIVSIFNWIISKIPTIS